MSQYLPSFNRDAKGKYNPELGFVSIKGGTDAYLLEDELNEIQWIQTEGRAQLVRQITKSGCLNIPRPNDSTKSGGIVELGKNYLNSFAIKGFDAILNGYIAHVDTDYEGGFKISLPEPPIVNIRYDFVYLEFWMKEIKLYEDVPRFGGYDNKPTSYDLVDPRMNIETTQRVQLQWAIRTLPDAIYPDIINNEIKNMNIYPQGPSSVVNQNYRYVKDAHDSFLFIAGDGSDTAKERLGTLDGKVYAIPLVVVKRLNKSGYNVRYNTNGGVDYVDETSVSGRPDDKFANIIYTDDIIDIRHLSALGEGQLDQLYLRITDFEAYEDFIKTNVQNVLETVEADLSGFHADYNSTTVRLDSKIDTVDNNLTTKHNEDVTGINARIDTLNETINATITASINSLSNRISSVQTSLTAYTDNQINVVEEEINQLRAEITTIINTDIVVINQEISDLQTQLTNVINIEIAGVNNKITNINAQLVSMGGQISSLDTKITTVHTELSNAMETTINEFTAELASTKNEILSQHNIDVTALNKRIDDIDATLTINLNIATADLNKKIDDLNTSVTGNINNIQIEINDCNIRIDALQSQLNSYNTTMSSFTSRLTALEADIRIIKLELASLFPDGTGSDLLLYGLDMNRKTPTTVGGIIQPDSTIVSTGILIGVTFTNKKDFSVIITPQRSADQSVPDGSIGDIWVERSDTSFAFKNTGLAGIGCDVFVVKNDRNAASKYVYSNANSDTYSAKTFAGYGSSTRVDIPLRIDSDIVYIMPTQNYKGEVGEIYISIDPNGFNVFNTGQAGNQFEWTVIDTTSYGSGGRIRNILVYDIDLPGHDAYYSQPGQFGGDFYNVMVSTPMITTDAGQELLAPGTIGDISVTKNTGYFTLFNTGDSTCKVRCCVFKQVDPQIAASGSGA